VDYNAWFDNPGWAPTIPCGTNGVSFGTTSPFADDVMTTTLTQQPDFHLSGAAGSTVADDLVDPTSSDYALSTDIDGDSRSVPRDAGAYER
jgi:hypothetical protein